MSYWARATGLIALRPVLWPTAARQSFRLSPPGWWRRPPFVPRPDPAYLRHRMETQYGSGAYGSAGATDPRDVIAYLQWCRAMSPRRLRRRR